jgi:hypothetical protein
LIILNFRFLLRFAKKTDNRAADHRGLVAIGTGQRIDRVLRDPAQTDTTGHDRHAVEQQDAEPTGRVVSDLSHRYLPFAAYRFFRQKFDLGTPQAAGASKEGDLEHSVMCVRPLATLSWRLRQQSLYDPNGAGRAISFALAPGQAHELRLAPDLVGCLPDLPGWIIGDRGYSSQAFRRLIWV